MRIAFDLDDTIIPGRIPFPVYPRPRNPIRRWLCREPLRVDCVELINELRADGHEVWVYTTSYRDPFWTKLMFWAYGTRVGRVINNSEHDRMMEKMGHAYSRCTKFPPAFGIDLLIDECGGVLLESQEYGFEIVQVLPDDLDWAEKIRQRVGRDKQKSDTQ